jgi:hypothetical protein
MIPGGFGGGPLGPGYSVRGSAEQPDVRASVVELADGLDVAVWPDITKPSLKLSS